MWRLWTRGWGLRNWWYWFRLEGFPLWVARHLPNRVTYWAFIMVSGASGRSPDYPTGDYQDAHDYWYYAVMGEK